MAGGVSGYPAVAGSLGEQKRKGETPTGRFGISYTVICPYARRVYELVDRCCSCNRHSICSTMGPSTRVCKCRNAGRQCMGCYCWGRCKKKGWVILSPTTARVLIGHFPRGVEPATVIQCASPPPVWSPTYLSLWAILASRAMEGGAWGGTRGSAGGCKSLRGGGGGGRVAGGRTSNRGRSKRDKAGAVSGMTEATETMAMA